MSLSRYIFLLSLPALAAGCTTHAAKTDATFDAAKGKSVIVSGVTCHSTTRSRCDVHITPKVINGNRVWQVTPPNGSVYNVYIVDPGFYTIHTSHSAGGIECNTFPRFSDKSIQVGINVGPGEIIYPGDIVLSISRGCPVDRLEIKNNLRTAQKELEKYPGIQGTLKYRPWFSRNPTLVPSNELPATTKTQPTTPALQPPGDLSN